MFFEPGLVTGVSEMDVVVRLVLVTLLSSIVGIEREYHHKPAGLRTNVMVGLGSAVFTLASIRAVDLFPAIAAIDPTRIAAQIVTGIGFLGAGTILFEKNRSSVIGLTTAATLWVVAGIGVTIGMGLYLEGILATILVFFTFLVLSRVVDRVRKVAIDHDHPDTAVEQSGNASTRIGD
jgi:putative Mg2+ transporter-C (MgtC) family protein